MPKGTSISTRIEVCVCANKRKAPQKNLREQSITTYFEENRNKYNEKH